MAIYEGTWETGGPYEPYLDEEEIVVARPNGGTVRSGRARKIGLPTAKQSANMITLGQVMRHYRLQLSDAERLSWQAASKPRQNRSGSVVAFTGQQKWLQANMSRIMGGLDYVTTQDKRAACSVNSLDFYLAYADDQDLYLDTYVNATIGSHTQFAVSVSQVPRRHIGKDQAWRYAIHCGTQEYNVDPVISTPIQFAYNYPAAIPFAVGDLVGLFVRVTLHANTNPPTTMNETKQTTEPWAALSRIAE